MGADRKVVLVTRRTRIEGLLAKYHTLAQARFYLEHLGADFADYAREHETYVAARRQATELLAQRGRHQAIDRDFLPNFLFAPDDIVVALGQDGLVANTMKYLTGQPLVGVNPDPARYDGVLLPFRPGDLPAVLAEIAAGKRQTRTVTMAKAALGDGQVLYAVNDLFIGPRTHVSARYRIEFAGRHEQQSSSGMIVSTGAGCSGWLRAITTGAWRVAQHFGELAGDPPELDELALGWESDRLWFSVREPFVSRTSRADIVFGQIEPGQTLTITSHMPDYGVIFSDGIEADYLAFNSGFIARVGLAERKAHLITR
jgi:NAD kinase